MILLIALLLLLTGSAFFALELVLQRRYDRALSGRIAEASQVRVARSKSILEKSNPTWLDELDARVRMAFSWGIGRSWGATAPTWLLVLMSFAGGAGCWLAVRHALHLPLWAGIALAALGALLPPRFLLRHQQGTAEAQFMEQFPEALGMIVRMVRAGLPVAAAIRTVGKETLPPISTVFTRINDALEIGIPLEDALVATGDRVGISDFRFFVVAVALQRATGSSLAGTLDTLSDIIRKRRAMRLKAKAATAEVRISAIVLAVIPFFIVGALAITAPSYLKPLIADPRGNAIAATALLSMVLAGLTMRALVRSATLER
jgi:tight adherence protein B